MKQNEKHFCLVCGTEDLSKFGPTASNPRGLSRYCIECDKDRCRAYRAKNPITPEKRQAKSSKICDRRLETHYGITRSEFQRMVLESNGLCAICKETMSPPHIDHDHKTNQVRGLLCQLCNMALGGFRDSPLFLRSAIEYLQKERPPAELFSLLMQFTYTRKRTK